MKEKARDALKSCRRGLMETNMPEDNGRVSRTESHLPRPRMSERLRLVWGADLPWKEKHVLLALNALVWDGARDFPSMDELAMITGLSRHTVLRAIDSLRTMGILLTQRRAAFRSGNTTLAYRMSWEGLAALPTIELGTVRKRDSEPTTRPLFRLGRLRSSKRAGRYYILGQWLLEWLQAGEVDRRPPEETANAQHTAAMNP